MKHEIVFLDVMMSNCFEMNSVYSYYMIIRSSYTVFVIKRCILFLIHCSTKTLPVGSPW